MAGALLVGPAALPLPEMLGEGILGVLFPELPPDFGCSMPMLDASLRFVMDPLGAVKNNSNYIGVPFHILKSLH